MAGDIAAAERVELTDTATVSGTLLSPAVVMREGARFNGAIAIEPSSRKRRALDGAQQTR
jgi:cytoskeletal protein CcmA (bactofilin family)